MTRMHMLALRHLPVPISGHQREYPGVRYVQRISGLALVLGWADEIRALTHTCLEVTGLHLAVRIHQQVPNGRGIQVI